MPARCSLDDFIIHNTKEIRVGPGTPRVSFSDYRVPAGGLFDVTLLWGQGYQLEASGKNINPADIGGADILDKEGQRTGYRLVSYGSGDFKEGSWWSGYYIENWLGQRTATQIVKRLESMQAAQQREREIMTARESASPAGLLR